MTYPIFRITGVESSQLEQLGTKAKFWFVDQHTGKLLLFKAGRPNTGENWAEKVCSEICMLIGLPHATYELANFDGKEGVITPSFTPEGSRLVHGNELLAKSSREQAGQINISARQHTLRRVMLQLGLDSLKLPLDHNLPSDVETVPDVFVGYLLLDALVGNQDRHFENWGLIFTPGEGAFLAPTYDHASSLGRNETDQRREVILTTKDKGQSLESYVRRAKSMMYPSNGNNGKKLLTSDAFSKAALIAPKGAHYWIEKLEALNEVEFGKLLAKVPDEIITQVTRDFAQAMLVENRHRLLNEFKSTMAKK